MHQQLPLPHHRLSFNVDKIFLMIFRNFSISIFNRYLFYIYLPIFNDLKNVIFYRRYIEENTKLFVRMVNATVDPMLIRIHYAEMASTTFEIARSLHIYIEFKISFLCADNQSAVKLSFNSIFHARPNHTIPHNSLN